MDLNPTHALSALQAGVGAIWALAITYSLSVLGAVILIVVGYTIAGLAQRAIYAGLGKIRGFDVTLRQFFSHTARYAILAVVIIMVLGQFGVQTASIIAALGAIGLAIGLALQGTLQNIAAGVMLLVLRPFRIGEYVEVGSVAGTIEEIGLFATRLRAVDGIFILAPNTKLWNEPVRNFNRNGVRRNDVTVGIGYDDDIDLAQKVLTDIALGDRRVKREPEPQAFVSDLGDSAVSITLRYWTSPADFLQTKLTLTKLAKTTFDKHGISIPYPQQEIVYKAPPEMAPPPPPAQLNS